MSSWGVNPSEEVCVRRFCKRPADHWVHQPQPWYANRARRLAYHEYEVCEKHELHLLPVFNDFGFTGLPKIYEFACYRCRTRFFCAKKDFWAQPDVAQRLVHSLEAFARAINASVERNRQTFTYPASP